MGFVFRNRSVLKVFISFKLFDNQITEKTYKYQPYIIQSIKSMLSSSS